MGVQRLLVILISCFVGKNCLGMTNAIPLSTLLEMGWTKFEVSEVYGFFKPVMQTQIKLSTSDNLLKREELSYSLFKTEIPWFSFIKISNNNQDGLVRIVLDFAKMPEDCEKTVPVLLPFELEQARSIRTFVDLFYLPEQVTFYSNRARLLTFVYPASADIKIYTKPMGSESIDKMIINKMPDIRKKTARFSWMNEFNAMCQLEIPSNLKEYEPKEWEKQPASDFRPWEMFTSVVNSNSITIKDKILPLLLQERIQVSEYSDSGLLTNKVVLSKYKIDGYPSVCTFSTGNDDKDKLEIIYQIQIDVEACLTNNVNCSIPRIHSFCKIPDSLSNFMPDVTPLIREDGDGWDIVLDAGEKNVVWCTYGRSVLDRKVAVLKSVRFCKSQMLSRRYSSLFFNPLTSYLVDGYQLFYYW